VLKAEVAGLVHKTEAGAVALGLSTRAQVRAAAQKMLALEPSELVLQRQVDGGDEWLVGAVRDPLYGVLVAVGAGGTRAELWRDTCQRLAPLSAADVEALLERPRLGQTLHGFRGAPPGDKDALAKLVRALAAAAMAHPEVAEVELNPVKVLPTGQGVMAVDIRVHLAHQAG
jgi:succinyl-CoA synthetase beta subunit